MTDANAVLFDIDGTLVDSNYLHVDAWHRALAETGHDVDAWRIHRCIGMDSAKLLETLIGVPEHEHASELHSRYYKEQTHRLRPFPRARELLRTLDEQGWTVVLATSAPQDELEILRGVLDVDDALAVVTSAADVETAKPEPDIVRVALERAGSDPAGTLLVGDTRWDVEAAGRAGVRTIGVLSGGIARAELEDAGAIAVYADVAELLDRLEDGPLGG
jgi:HAD superfamily hydrolase (TIGR01509 family)